MFLNFFFFFFFAYGKFGSHGLFAIYWISRNNGPRCIGATLYMNLLWSSALTTTIISESLSVQTQLSEDLMTDPEDNPQKFISILLESLFVLRKIPETAEVFYQNTIPFRVTVLRKIPETVIKL